jgi:hypothetical protein
MEENRISSLLISRTIEVHDSNIEGAEFEVVLPTLWGNGWNSDDPNDRKWFVKEILTQTRRCAETDHNFQVVAEESVFSHAEDVARIAEKEYFIHHVHVKCINSD